MPELKIPVKLRKQLDVFLASLKKIYQQDLVSVVLYGSAASGEYIDKHSNLNLLVVLVNTDPSHLRKASALVKKFGQLRPLFLTEPYINSSTDIFPIEFLDMQENYAVLCGKDCLKDIHIDTRNLRFQCEQELKVKLIQLKQLYLEFGQEDASSRLLLIKALTSLLHILRNVLRLKGRKPPYLKEEILKAIAAEFKITAGSWERILEAKNKQMKLAPKETEALLVDFIRDLETITDAVDRF